MFQSLPYTTPRLDVYRNLHIIFFSLIRVLFQNPEALILNIYGNYDLPFSLCGDSLDTYD